MNDYQHKQDRLCDTCCMATVRIGEDGVRLGTDEYIYQLEQKFIGLSKIAPTIEVLLNDHARLQDDNAYLTWKLEKVLPLFEQARDALSAISMAAVRLRGIDPHLASRMDEAGTANYDTWKDLGKPGLTSAIETCSTCGARYVVNTDHTCDKDDTRPKVKPSDADYADGFECSDCDHRHSGEKYAFICIGCHCPRREPDPTK